MLQNYDGTDGSWETQRATKKKKKTKAFSFLLKKLKNVIIEIYIRFIAIFLRHIIPFDIFTSVQFYASCYFHYFLLCLYYSYHLKKIKLTKLFAYVYIIFLYKLNITHCFVSVIHVFHLFHLINRDLFYLKMCLMEDNTFYLSPTFDIMDIY
jgi:hypothetical protein